MKNGCGHIQIEQFGWIISDFIMDENKYKIKGGGGAFGVGWGGRCTLESISLRMNQVADSVVIPDVTVLF